MTIKAKGTFSADVRLHLYVADEKLEVGQLGPDFAIFREPQTICASHGELETVIDGKSSRWKSDSPARLPANRKNSHSKR